MNLLQLLLRQRLYVVAERKEVNDVGKDKYVRQMPTNAEQANLNVRTCLCHGITHPNAAAADACERQAEAEGRHLSP